MRPIRKFTEKGIEYFRKWLEDGAPDRKTDGFIYDSEFTEICFMNIKLDPNKQFGSRFEFGDYLCNTFVEIEFDILAPEYDTMWAWINALYFPQLLPRKVRKYEHYIPARGGAGRRKVHSP